MKLFSLEEANALLPTVKGMVGRIQRAYRRLLSYAEAAKHAAAGAELGGGGMVEGPGYIALLMELSSLTGQLDALGVQMKDYGRGLIDFPSMRDGRIVLLCWEMGEGDELEWWHDLDAGYSGRQPL
ncbi:MAG TPA: DUF2203 domain-containing protein [Pyrinomonadaceae bacterium]|jgi:hypothetical protein